MSDFIDAYLQKGRALSAIGIYHEAVDAFKHVLSLNPDDLTALYGQARAFDHLGMYEDAVVTYTHISQIEPACERVFYYKGIALVNIRHYPDAIDAFSKSLALNPLRPEAWSEMGRELTYLKNTRRQWRHLINFLNSNPIQLTSCLKRDLLFLT